MGSEEDTKIEKFSRRRRLLFAACTGALLPTALLAANLSSFDATELFAIFKSTPRGAVERPETKAAAEIKKEDGRFDADSLSLLKEIDGRCRSARPPKYGAARTGAELRPVWVAQWPNTLSANLNTDLIRATTGMDTGGKKFYASRPGLRHCIEKSAPQSTVTCLVSHPVVELNKGMPDSYAAKQFEKSVYILALRNPMTSLPFHSNAKAVEYHGMVGQMPATNWRELRDEWFDDQIKKWIATITVWDDTVYQRAIYLSFEDLMCPRRGPEVLGNLSDELSRLGFPALPSHDDDECAWYGAVGGKGVLEPYYRNGRYEYGGYRPGFTQGQKQKMIQALDDLVGSRFKSSGEVIKKILGGYLDDIRNHVIIDSGEA